MEFVESQKGDGPSREGADPIDDRLLGKINDLGEGVVLLDREGRIQYANQRFAEMADTDPARLIGMRGDVLFDPKPEWRTAVLADHAHQPGGSYKHEFRLNRADGSHFWVALSATAHTRENGEAAGVLALVTDINARKQMEENQALVLDILTVPFDSDFFVEVARKLAETFGAEVAFIAECRAQGSVRTIACWQSGSSRENRTYELAGTICEAVVGREPAFYASNACGLFPNDRALNEMRIEGYVGVPLSDSQGKPLGHFALMHSAPFPGRCRLVETLEMIGARIRSEIERNRREALLQQRNQKLENEIAARKRADATINYFRDEIGQNHNMGNAVGESPAFRQVLENIGLVAKNDVTVLISGETGTGKELVARMIHEQSPRAAYPLVKVNCAALPQDLVEAELFGHEKGAFTSAQSRRKGRFELADRGTLFLDEIGELSLSAQAKILRVLQEKEFERVGGGEPIQVDFRLIAATNRDLTAMVSKGAFRDDLFYRLNVFPLPVPPLRERKHDIPLLANYFLARFSRSLGKDFSGIHPDSLNMLIDHDWPGNIRELENQIHRSAILSSQPLLRVACFNRLAASGGTRLEDIERAHITALLAQTNGRIEGDQGAARLLGLNPSTLRSKMKKLGIA